MSTRCTIGYDDNFHLYQECFEQDNVYLKLEKGSWSASIETSVIDWRDGDATHPQLHVKIDVTLWRKIVESWIESQWGKNPEYDHKKFEIDNDAISDWVAKMKSKRGEGGE
jgi:hypothetical protein